MKSRVLRDRLPSPPTYFDSIGLKLHGRGAWRSALCPFHDDKQPSLRVQYAQGAFRCMACGAHGSDVLAFHRLRTGLGLADAARALGAWRQP
jgi:DNA primase